jgi:hypothetical protein
MAIAREGGDLHQFLFSRHALSPRFQFQVPHRSRQFFLRPRLSYLLPEVDLSVKRSGFYRDACGDALKLAAMTTKVIHLFQRHYKIASETNSKSQAMLRSESR